MSDDRRTYPRHVATDAGDIEIRLMAPADEAAVLDFAQKLPAHDLLFLPRNISEPKVLAAWIKEIERGAITSLLAVKAGRVVGCGTHRARSAFVVAACRRNPHVVSPDVRGQGVGRALSQETFALALGAGLEKLLGPDDGRPDRRDRDFRRPRLQGRGAAARPCPRSRRQKARYRRARRTMSRRSGPRWKPMGCRRRSSPKAGREPVYRADCSQDLC